MGHDDSDDDDTFVSIGTPYEVPEEDEPLKKPAKVQDQIAVDKQGRRRFHGAFTGGFSAGYYNTVGSKEGWAPSTFVSSRSKRNEGEDQVMTIPEDFMDEDDFAEHGIAPRKLKTTTTFQAEDVELQRRKRNAQKAVDDGEIHSAIPGGVPIDDLILPSKLSIGIKLLKKMGWKPGQGIGEKIEALSDQLDTTFAKKKVYGCARPQEADSMDMKTFTGLLAPKDVQPYQFSRKDNIHGIGYSGIDPAMAMFGGINREEKPFRPTGVEKKGIKGQAFGVGVFEDEDDDIYGHDALSNYDLTMADEETNHTYGWSGETKKHTYKGCLLGFIKTSKPLTLRKLPVIITIPAGYIPKHQFPEKQRKQQEKDSSKSKLSSKERSVMLGETSKGLETVSPWTLKWDKRPEGRETKNAETKKSSRWDTSRIAEIKSTTGDDPTSASSASYDTHTGAFQPFAKFPAKQERYEQFLLARKANKKVELVYDINVTEWEREGELEEFTRAAVLYRPLSSSISTRFTRATVVTSDVDNNSKTQQTDHETQQTDDKKAATMGMFGKLTRTVLDWHPDRVLCKRFNIPPPYLNSKLKGVPGRCKKKGGGFFGDTAFEKSVPSIENSSKAPSTVLNGENESDILKKREKNRKIKIGPLSHLNKTVETVNAMESKFTNNTTNAGEPIETVSHKDGETSTKPSFDMFKAIFDNSDSSDSDEDKIPEKGEEVLTQNLNIALPQAFVGKVQSNANNGVVEEKIKESTEEEGLNIEKEETHSVDVTLQCSKAGKTLPLAFLNKHIDKHENLIKNVHGDKNRSAFDPEKPEDEIKSSDDKLEKATSNQNRKPRFEKSPFMPDKKMQSDEKERSIVQAGISSEDDDEWKEEAKSNSCKTKKSKKEKKHKKERKRKKRKKKNYSSSHESEDEDGLERHKKVRKHKKKERYASRKNSSSSSEEALVPSNAELLQKLQTYVKTKKRPSAADFM